MQLESLRYYWEVIQAESITKAASNIFISQQGLSKSIQALEKEFHVTLLKRSANGKTVPTEAGQEFLIAAQDILTKMESLKERMAHYAQDGSSIKEVGTITILVTTYLANMLDFLFDRHEFQEKFSGEIIVLEKSFGKICKTLYESPFNTVAVVNVCPSLIEERMVPEGFVFDPIISMDIMLRCSSDSPVGKKKSVTLEEVRRLPLALYKESMLSTVLKELFGEIELNVVMHTTNMHEIKKAVARGDVVTFTDTFAQSALSRGLGESLDRKDYVCLPIQGNTQFVVGFLSLKGAERATECLRYEAFCKKYIAMKYGLYMKRHPLTFSPRAMSCTTDS